MPQREREMARSMGVEFVLEKPLDMSQLEAVIKATYARVHPATGS